MRKLLATAACSSRDYDKGGTSFSGRANTTSPPDNRPRHRSPDSSDVLQRVQPERSRGRKGAKLMHRNEDPYEACESWAQELQDIYMEGATHHGGPHGKLDVGAAARKGPIFGRRAEAPPSRWRPRCGATAYDGGPAESHPETQGSTPGLARKEPNHGKRQHHSQGLYLLLRSRSSRTRRMLVFIRRRKRRFEVI